jgi:MOSC domain-containing protein YiiM
MVRRILAAGRSGYHLRIVTEGDVTAGDEITLVERQPAAVAVSEIHRLSTRDRDEVESLRRVLAVGALPAECKGFFAQLLTGESAAWAG